MPQTLEYAAPRDAAPWGPVLVRPSRPSILLFLLTAAVATWIGFRHEPWVPLASVTLPATTPAAPRVARTLTTRQPPPTATNVELQNDFLVTHDDGVVEVRVWDAATGQLIRTIGQEPGAGGLRFPVGYYIVDRGRYVLARSLGRNTGELIEPRTGRVVNRAPGLPPPGRVIDVSAAAPDHAVLYGIESSVEGGKLNATTFGIWRTFALPANNPAHTFQLPRDTTARFSPDGRTIVFTFHVAFPMPDGLDARQRMAWQTQTGPGPYSTRRAQLYDVSSGRLMAELPDRDTMTDPVFSDDGQVLISVFDPSPPPPQAAMYLRQGYQPPRGLAPTSAPTTTATAAIQRHSARTGELLSSVPVPTGLAQVTPFADGAHAVAGVYAPRGLGSAYSSSIIDLRAAATPPVSLSGSPYRLGPAAAFPDGRRVLAGHGAPATAAIFDADSAQPLARLTEQTAGMTAAQISPDGRRAAILRYDGIHIFRKVGLECRESHFGVVGMPHVWLLGGLMVALALSFRADARRAPSTAFLSPSVATVALMLLVLALPRTFHAVLAAVSGEWLMTPAPLLLLCAFGLATGARFWRMVTVVVLAAVLPLDAYCIFDLHRAGFGTPYRLEVIDRTFEIPRVIVFAMMALFTGLCVPAMVLLVRPPRRID